ncbi:CHCHD2 [Mytilus coruscus]|uniref:CHCHD2 n=1 Tax=Mytilus coruscus TaxID=42192 RepID=A0A6J8BB99_MYTCO|nr:CHCHD2 [Mytilus coruscus]
MPRRKRSAPARRRRSPSFVPARAPPASPAHPPATQPRQPGLMAQMATTAAGVAVGSAVGHTLGVAMTGGSDSETLPAYQEPVYQQTHQQPCQVEFKQFIECTQTQNDISMCQGLNEVLRECKLKFGKLYLRFRMPYQSRGASGQASTVAFHPQSFDFKPEGIKFEFNFNTDRISALRRGEHLPNSESHHKTVDIQSTVKTEIDTLNQRNKILKIADRHGWDTAHEYLDDPLAYSVEDALKLRNAVFRASRKRTANKH